VCSNQGQLNRERPIFGNMNCGKQHVSENIPCVCREVERATTESVESLNFGAFTGD
jgi:hypothetical protein